MGQPESERGQKRQAEKRSGPTERTCALLDAKRTAQGSDTAYIYHWREHERWKYGGITESHNGTEGCPGI